MQHGPGFDRHQAFENAKASYQDALRFILDEPFSAKSPLKELMHVVGSHETLAHPAIGS